MTQQPLTWHCASGFILVFDPSTRKETIGGAFPISVRLPAATGRWHGAVRREPQYGRVAELRSWLAGTSPTDGHWTPCKVQVGVGTGLAGFFDWGVVPAGERSEAFYQQCLKAAPGDSAVGVVAQRPHSVPMGLVSSSGYGDGLYDLRYREHDGAITGLCLVFVTPSSTQRFERFLNGHDPRGRVLDMVMDPYMVWSIAYRGTVGH